MEVDVEEREEEDVTSINIQRRRGRLVDDKVKSAKKKSCCNMRRW